MEDSKPKDFACYRNLWKCYFFEVFVFAGSTLPRCITRKPVVIAWSGSWTVNGIGNRKLDL